MWEFSVLGTKVEKSTFSLLVCWRSPVVLSITSVTRKLHFST